MTRFWDVRLRTARYFGAGVREGSSAEASFFARAKPEDVQEILETLVAMGLAHRGKTKGTYLP